MQLRAGNLDRNEEKLQVQRDILNLHAEMVLLLHYSVLNFTGTHRFRFVSLHLWIWTWQVALLTKYRRIKLPSFNSHLMILNSIHAGLVKIVKKHNKRTGTSFHFSSMPRVMQRPFFSTDLLYELMRQCETMLDGLFLSKQPWGHYSNIHSLYYISMNNTSHAHFNNEGRLLSQRFVICFTIFCIFLEATWNW